MLLEPYKKPMTLQECIDAEHTLSARVELPVRVTTVANEDLGVEEYEDGRALFTIAHIAYITEQLSDKDTTLITMIDGRDITVLLSYSDVKELIGND